jgi:outer membrane receptor for ferrienterochelin and colicin
MDRRLAPAALALALAASPRPAAGGDLDFFEEESRVVTASRAPVGASRAPATVYVVTGDEIRLSGARTLWEALRSVPGVDVVTTGAGQGEVSIRGLNGPLSNRTLVLLDGRAVLNAYFDFMIWEELPVSVEEIDRIEVVEGPASALYGANALTGVIHIITKSPDAIKGGLVTAAAGEGRARRMGALAGGRAGAVSYKASAGWRSEDVFEGKEPASRVPRGHFWLGRDLEGGGQAALSAGFSAVDTRLTTGLYGVAVADGPVGFAKADLDRGGWRARAYWNHARILARDYSLLGSPNLDHDNYDLQVEKSAAWASHVLTGGGWYRRNTMRSRMFQSGLLSQDLWAAFLEDAWSPAERWRLTAGARLDRHPFTDLTFSPRGAVVWTPTDRQSLRLSAGSSFRNPTLLENHVDLPVLLPNTPGGAVPYPLFTALNVRLTGNRELKAERMNLYEASHRLRLPRATVTAAVFRYKISDVVAATPPAASGPSSPPVADLSSTFANQGLTRAWGGELGAESAPGALTGFANASYLSLKDRPGSATRAEAAPRWKLNGGLRARAGSLSCGATAHWVDETLVEAYALLDVYAGWRFGGAEGVLEVFGSGSNVGGKRHREWPAANYAEEVASRWIAGATWRF